jgi:hypothetical protein
LDSCPHSRPRSRSGRCPRQIHPGVGQRHRSAPCRARSGGYIHNHDQYDNDYYDHHHDYDNHDGSDHYYNHGADHDHNSAHNDHHRTASRDEALCDRARNY